MGDHDLLDYCTFGLQTVNVAQFVRVDNLTQLAEKITTSRIYQNDNMISQHMTKSLEMSKDIL